MPRLAVVRHEREVSAVTYVGSHHREILVLTLLALASHVAREGKAA